MLDITIHKTISSLLNLILSTTLLFIIIILPFVLSGCKTTNTSSDQDAGQLMPNLLRPEKAEVPQRTIMPMPGALKSGP